MAILEASLLVLKGMSTVVTVAGLLKLLFGEVGLGVWG